MSTELLLSFIFHTIDVSREYSELYRVLFVTVSLFAGAVTVVFWPHEQNRNENTNKYAALFAAVLLQYLNIFIIKPIL